MKIKHFKDNRINAVLKTVFVTSLLLTGGVTAQTVDEVEAESSNYYGGSIVETEHAGYIGNAYLGGFTDVNKGSAGVDFTVSVPENGNYSLTTRYTNGTGSARTLSLYIDQQYVQQLTFAPGNNWADWQQQVNTLTLPSGQRMLSLRFDNQDSGNINVDNITLSSDAVTNPPTSSSLTINQALEFENTNLTGGTQVETNHNGYSGAGFVAGFIDANQGQAKTAFNVEISEPGTYNLDVRYANGTGASRSLSFVNGTNSNTIEFPATANWDSWGNSSHQSYFDAGSYNLAYLYAGNNSGNVNLDKISLSLLTPTEPEPEPTPDPTPEPEPTPVAIGEFDATSVQYSGGLVIENEHAGYSGQGYLGGFTDINKGTGQIAFQLDIPETGLYSFNIRYANGTPTAQTLTFAGDNIQAQQVSFTSSGGWASWATLTVNANLTMGMQNFYLQFTHADSGNVNIDSFDIELNTQTIPDPDPDPTPIPDPTPVPPMNGDVYQAESGFYSGGAYQTTQLANYHGNGAVIQTTANTSRIIATVNAAQAGEQTVTFRYQNTTGVEQKANVVIDGLAAGEINFPASNGWQEQAYSFNFHQGIGTISLEQSSASTGEYAIDQITLANGSPMLARGATVAYTAYEAEAGNTNAEILAPSRVFHEVAAEASGRQAVRLNNYGDYVEFTLTQAANAFVLRSSIPDTIDGYGEAHNLGIYANGTKLTDHQVSSYFSWVYGSYPYGNTPSQGSPQRFFDGSRMLLGQTLPAGTILRLEKDNNAHAAYYDIDLIETELVAAPRSKPASYFSITEYGAVANDGIDDLNAIRNAVAAAQASGTGVWIPQGEFTISDRFNLANVAVVGAGPWYSSIAGLNGKGGLYATGSNVTIAHLMIDGDVRYRDDGAFHAALEGNFGTGSLIQNVWAEHTKVGLWTSAGTDGLLAVGLRIRNTFADGVNLHTNIKDTHITQSVIRNTGDDALAMWSSGSPVTRSAFINNTVQTPLLGNGAGIYGGTNNAVLNNFFVDTLTGSAGVAVGTRFNPTPLAGVTRIENCTLLRTGGYEPNWQSQLGAIWVFADSANITAPIVINNIDIIDSTHQALLVSWQKTVANLSFTNINIDGVQANGSNADYAIEFQAQGDAYFENVTLNNSAAGMTVWPEFIVTMGAGNSGF